MNVPYTMVSLMFPINSVIASTAGVCNPVIFQHDTNGIMRISTVGCKRSLNDKIHDVLQRSAAIMLSPSINVRARQSAPRPAERVMPYHAKMCTNCKHHWLCHRPVAYKVQNADPIFLCVNGLDGQVVVDQLWQHTTHVLLVLFATALEVHNLQHELSDS